MRHGYTGHWLIAGKVRLQLRGFGRSQLVAATQSVFFYWAIDLIGISTEESEESDIRLIRHLSVQISVSCQSSLGKGRLESTWSKPIPSTCHVVRCPSHSSHYRCSIPSERSVRHFEFSKLSKFSQLVQSGDGQLLQRVGHPVELSTLIS